MKPETPVPWWGNVFNGAVSSLDYPIMTAAWSRCPADIYLFVCFYEDFHKTEQIFMMPLSIWLAQVQLNFHHHLQYNSQSTWRGIHAWECYSCTTVWLVGWISSTLANTGSIWLLCNLTGRPGGSQTMTKDELESHSMKAFQDIPSENILLFLHVFRLGGRVNTFHYSTHKPFFSVCIWEH